ncbi:MAG: 2-(1,2-epoxy,2-dihydrophenyl)acetyl-CoA isomerase [Mycobacterium sp.]|nr:2-(1,2-epoxy,2-dihydrophenyl)acetyl-CoA isomerase [Mycobacterium sp.]
MADDGSVTAQRDASVLRITLDRPAQRNSLSHTMVDALVAILTDAALDGSLRAVHITGAGGDFCAGADLGAPNRDGPRPRAGDIVRRIPHTAHRVIELIHTIHLPVVCSVRGYAVGLGCNLALAADFTVADAGAVFWEPFMARGFTPDSGATWLLPRLVGLTRAKEMLLLGDKVTAADAAEWGLIHRCVADGQLDATAAELLDRLANGPTVAIGLTKQAIASAQHATLSQAMSQELFNVELSSRTGDFKEGMSAFKERRTPRFDGR